MFWKKRQPGFAKQIGMTPPQPSAGRDGLAIVFLVKNEAVNLPEWVGFHKLVGARHFFAYHDHSTDNTEEVLRETLDVSELTITPWRNTNSYDVRRKRFISNQVTAYVHAIMNHGENFRWMAFIDVDEFILPMQKDTIEEALAHLEGFPNVSLPWHMFGRCGHEEKPQGGVLRNYTQRAADPMTNLTGVRNFKCIVDPCKVTMVSLHGFRTSDHGDVTCNDAGKRANSGRRVKPDFYSAEHLKLYHYYTKSNAELQAKLKRGSASPVDNAHHVERVMKAVHNVEADTVPDLDMVKFIDEKGFSFGSCM